jgi:antitoxin (DNA-binding transcriptional repressor) of toxin-antitoxin stability system
MITQIDVDELGPKFEELVDNLERHGGEISLARGGKIVAKLVRVESPSESDSAPVEGKVFYNGRWMIPAGAERERSIEHLRGSIKILGDIVSPIDDVEWDALK